MADDTWEIISVLNRYADACDARDWDLFERVFAPEATATYGGFDVGDRGRIVAMVRRFLEHCGPTQHLLGNFWVEVSGETAASRCNLRAVHQSRDEPPQIYECLGTYHDQLRRTPEGWRIVKRTMTISLELGSRDVIAPTPG